MKKTGTTSKRASGDARPITDADWARAKYRVAGKDVDKTEWQAAARAQLGGKQRITILVDGDVLAAFKAKAGERGYQTLINQALRQSLERETLEATLRQVVREELAGRLAACVATRGAGESGRLRQVPVSHYNSASVRPRWRVDPRITTEPRGSIMYAVVVTGGKQYRVAQGETLRVEKLEAEAGSEIKFDDVLLLGDSDGIQVGDALKGASVTATVVAHGRADKVRIIKFRRRKHHMKRQGHRQYYTEIQITGIAGGNK